MDSGPPRPVDRRGLTLLELLVVLAIIAILATIAIVNMQGAAVRSKVAAVKSDLRTIAAALESYHVDNKAYPEDYAEYRPQGAGYGMGRLTSPIAYISAVPLDPFRGYIDPANGKHVVSYTLGTEPSERPSRWMLTSAGPNQIDETFPAFDYPGYSPEIFDNPASGYTYLRYDPTNGTVSPGDVIRVSDAHFE